MQSALAVVSQCFWQTNDKKKWLKVLGVQYKLMIHEAQHPTEQNVTSSSAELAGV